MTTAETLDGYAVWEDDDLASVSGPDLIAGRRKRARRRRS